MSHAVTAPRATLVALAVLCAAPALAQDQTYTSPEGFSILLPDQWEQPEAGFATHGEYYIDSGLDYGSVTLELHQLDEGEPSGAAAMQSHLESSRGFLRADPAEEEIGGYRTVTVDVYSGDDVSRRVRDVYLSPRVFVRIVSRYEGYYEPQQGDDEWAGEARELSTRIVDSFRVLDAQRIVELASGAHLVEHVFTSPEGYSILVPAGWYDPNGTLEDFLGPRLKLRDGASQVSVRLLFVDAEGDKVASLLNYVANFADPVGDAVEANAGGLHTITLEAQGEDRRYLVRDVHLSSGAAMRLVADVRDEAAFPAARRIIESFEVVDPASIEALVEGL